jgi:hypothetical protein
MLSIATPEEIAGTQAMQLKVQQRMHVTNKSLNIKDYGSH